MKRFALVAGAAVLGLSALSACGNGGNGASADAPNTQNPTTPASPSYSAGPSDGTRLATADAGALGKIVVDGAGRTLYVFDKDTANPSKSNCDGDCAANWPPVPAGTDAPQLDGVDASVVGTVTRTDGTKQLTLAGHPLYQFAKDMKPGDVMGQGFFNGVWWVVGPDGNKITTATSPTGK
jgi:predicted lipoprotein with Yx(FWY)xxD motif